MQAAEGPIAQLPQVNVEQTLESKTDKVSEYRKMVDNYSEKYNVSADDIWKTIGCETGYQYDTNMQANAILSYGRERSYGLAMIHLPSHPYVTEAQAKDPEFAINFITSNWTKHKTWWVCARKLK